MPTPVGSKANPKRRLHGSQSPYTTLNPTERAAELVAAELERPGTILWRTDWRRAAQVHIANAHRLQALLPGQIETALDMLAIRGLVQARHDDDDLGPCLPQSYRWSPHATTERLQAYAAPPKRAEVEGRCHGPDCDSAAPEGLLYCSRTCGVRAAKAAKAAKDKP